MKESNPKDFELEKVIHKRGNEVSIEILQKKSDKSKKIIRKRINYTNISDLNRKSKEYLAMIEFKHDNIAEIDSILLNEQENTLELYLKYYPEGDLQDLIVSRESIGYWTDYEIMKMIKDLIYAYEFLQRNKIAHRDIKPKNILVSNKKTKLKVSDFGVSKRIENFSELEVAGTPFYLSPLLKTAYTKHQSKVIHNPYKSDAYSLGLVILEMMTLGFKNRNLQEVIDQSFDFQSLIENLSQDYPVSSMIVKKMIVNDEDARFDFIALKNYLDIIYQSKFTFVCCGCNKQRLADDYYIFNDEAMCKICVDTLQTYPVVDDNFQIICTRCEEILDPGFECSCGKRCLTCKAFHDYEDSCYETLNSITGSELNISVHCINCNGLAYRFINNWVLCCAGCEANFCIVCFMDCRQKSHYACHFIMRKRNLL